MMKKALLALTLLVGTTAYPCINDRDTLAFELRNVDATKRVRTETNYRKKAEAAQEIALKAIGGRFERYPPKYYEMRIARLEGQASLTALEYDDLAVAYERLGKTDKAIEILLASKPHRSTKDDAYRFHANYGTFLVHKWLAQKNREDKKVLKQSITEIETALKINPGSHFGREKVQLELERLWLTGKDIVPADDVEQVVGLAGIVMMGLAYELPDAYVLMTGFYLGAEESLFDDFAISRAQELIAKGNKLVSKPLESELETSSREKDQKPYKDLRADGEKVHQARLAYLNERLNRGEHPDTHPDFWKEWKEPPLPVLKRIPGLHAADLSNFINSVAIGAGALAGVVILGVLVWVLYRRSKRA